MEIKSDVADIPDTLLRPDLADGRSLGDDRPMRDSKTFGFIARGGLVCYAVVHLLVAWLATRVALGDTAKADKAGALQVVVAEGGAWLLWLIATGLAVLALWQLGEAVTGHRHVKARRRTVRRIVSGIEVVLYGLVSYSAVKIAVAGADDGQTSLVAEILAESYGPVLVSVAGVAVVAVAVFLAQRGLRKTFARELDFGGASGPARTTTIRLGQVGWIALSAAYGTVGVLTVIAAVTFDPAKASGLDAALKTLVAQPYGGPMLLALAAGIAAFGVFALLDARFRKI
ncbi:DUF1206 domain-containing protein [Amycolatopsis azurea]|uniref:Membrane protein, putative n=1 Tax=Amycolatopsis azurea DSM 43854 TaxID=1238180 RepID=M2QGU2_9PSEU|nr:DUF1206 domain-containing protein [Amycolatopsis azurea]EMD25217.1 Membrane protein, putative [Amycolatopsis azurea DSM 43854]OOC01638.1 hypothetical protein B0293_35430 [Amycolatopsis azurea DSM 43854]